MAATTTNRLAQETSPYLLQHQHNPVDWYAWGPEAFEAARQQGKPIFLSVGYSTCYWCHVMERQSFENDAIAAEMNKRFINIKVDREERPDVDQLYMIAVQILTRQGGWPMSVFLTPDLRPFYGGTYFPPTDMYGRPGFVTVLRGIEDAYKTRKHDVEQTAQDLVGYLRQLSEPEPPTRPITIDRDYLDTLVVRSIDDYESVHGGFGNAPKFPRETLLELLLHYTAEPAAPHEQSQIATRKTQVQSMLRHTLDAMAYGGIRDQLGGGFHRYSTDAQWLVPHFEIMLYDNAMLAWCYAEASRQMGEPRYAQVARDVFDFVLREMTSPDGAFYTAFDAEVDAQEGLSYLWTIEEVEQVLRGEDAQLFNRVYGVDQGPNFADPHHGTGTPDKSILFVAEPDALAQHAERLAPMRQKLKAVRDRRKQPLLDTKVITSWNGLMIRALAFGGQVLGEPRYVDAAARAAEFILREHRTPTGGLRRTSRNGVLKYDGFLDDYAFLAQALLALHDATGRDEWRQHAETIAAAMEQRFGDDGRNAGAAGGYFFSDADAKDLIVRQKTGSDSPLPSGNAIAAMAVQQLGRPQRARATLALFASQLQRGSESMSSMVQAALAYVKQHGPIEVQPTAGGASRAQEEFETPEEVAGGVVELAARWASPAQLEVQVQVLDGFHVNANRASANLVPTSLAVRGIDSREIAGIDYPPGEEQAFAFAPDAPIRVYAGVVTLAVRFHRAPAAGSPIELRLTYQACTDTACLPPVAKVLTAPPPST